MFQISAGACGLGPFVLLLLIGESVANCVLMHNGKAHLLHFNHTGHVASHSCVYYVCQLMVCESTGCMNILYMKLDPSAFAKLSMITHP